MPKRDLVRRIDQRAATGTAGSGGSGAASGNADTVDGIHASRTPTANMLVPLDASALLPAAALPPISIDSLSDVAISGTPADNELLAWDTAGAGWINQTAAEAGVQPTLTTGNLTATSPLVFDQTRSVIGGAAVVSLGTQAANYALAGPATGAAAAPTFRALVDADIPTGVMRDSEHTAIGDAAPHHARLHTHTDALDGWVDNRFGTGIEDRTKSTLSLSTRTVTIAPTSVSFNIYTRGTKIVKTTGASCSTEIANTVGIHYIYFDNAGVLQNATSPWSITGDGVPVAIVFWNGAAGRIWDERHSAARNQEWHLWAHDTIGMRWESGLGGTFTDTTLSILSGFVHDEDLDHSISPTQTTCILAYRTAGALNMTFVAAASSTPYLMNGANLRYDNAGALADIASNHYGVSWLYATNDLTTPIYCVLGQGDYTTLSLAQAAPQPSIPITTAEWKLLYRVIYRNVGATPTYVQADDYRNVVGVPTASPSLATVLAANVNTDTTNFGGVLSTANTTVQSALDTLDDNVLRTSGAAAGSVSQAQSFGATGIKADVIAESTSTAGVTVDGVLLKDSASLPRGRVCPRQSPFGGF